MNKNWTHKFSDHKIKNSVENFVAQVIARGTNVIDGNVITSNQLPELIENLKNSKNNAISSSVFGYSDFVDKFAARLSDMGFKNSGRLWLSYSEFTKQANNLINDSKGIKEPEYRFRAYYSGVEELCRLVDKDIPHKKLVSDRIIKDFEKAKISDDVNEKNIACENFLVVLGGLDENHQIQILESANKALESIFLSFRPHITKAFEQTTGRKVELNERGI
jgi:hypothetical protein